MWTKVKNTVKELSDLIEVSKCVWDATSSSAFSGSKELLTRKGADSGALADFDVVISFDVGQYGQVTDI